MLNYFNPNNTMFLINRLRKFVFASALKSPLFDNQNYSKSFFEVLEKIVKQKYLILIFRLSNYNLSHNPVAVESQLFGIGSTNLVEPRSSIQNQAKKLPNVTFFYRNNIIMPNKLVVEKNQRALIQ